MQAYGSLLGHSWAEGSSGRLTNICARNLQRRAAKIAVCLKRLECFCGPKPKTRVYFTAVL